MGGWLPKAVSNRVPTYTPGRLTSRVSLPACIMSIVSGTEPGSRLRFQGVGGHRAGYMDSFGW